MKIFTIGERSGKINGKGPLVTAGIYCANGEEQRGKIREWRQDFDKAFGECPFDFQDWESGTRMARRILFVRMADYLNPTIDLFKRMADDYERIREIMKRHKLLC